MTVGFGRGFPRLWALPIGAMTLLLGYAAVGGLSRSIVADLAAWWPVWVGLGVAAYLGRERSVGPVRLPGVVPLAALVFVVLFAVGHVAGWAIMPSAAQRLHGPEVEGIARARLTAAVDGAIRVSPGADRLYVVTPIRGAGDIGIPSAGEGVIGSTITVRLQPPEDPGIYSYAGWDLRLSTIPVWSLHLAGAVEADLSALEVESLEVEGAGTLRLGAASATTPLRVSGAYRIVIPPGSPARVDGVASVPASWVPDQSGAASPGGGDGWAITVVSGATVSVVEG